MESRARRETLWLGRHWQLMAWEGWETPLATKAFTCQLDLVDVGL